VGGGGGWGGCGGGGGWGGGGFSSFVWEQGDLRESWPEAARVQKRRKKNVVSNQDQEKELIHLKVRSKLKSYCTTEVPNCWGKKSP